MKTNFHKKNFALKTRFEEEANMNSDMAYSRPKVSNYFDMPNPKVDYASRSPTLAFNLVPRVSPLCLHCRWEKTDPGNEVALALSLG